MKEPVTIATQSGDTSVMIADAVMLPDRIRRATAMESDARTSDTTERDIAGRAPNPSEKIRPAKHGRNT